MKKPTPKRMFQSAHSLIQRRPDPRLNAPAVPKLNIHSKAIQPVKRAVIKPQSLVKPPASPLVQKKSSIQCFPSRVVQAIKLYPNLHPGAIEPVDPNNVFSLRHFAGQYRLHRQHSHGVNVPNQQYNFVRTRDGEMLLHNRYRPPSIADGKQVLYAGEIYFNNGPL